MLLGTSFLTNVSPTRVKKCDCNGNSYHSNCRRPWRTLAKTPKAVNENKQCACHSSTKTFLTPLGIGLNKKRRKRLESGLKTDCQSVPTKKCKNCTENVPFYDEVAYLHGCKYAYPFLSLPVDDAQKNGRKRRIPE